MIKETQKQLGDTMKALSTDVKDFMMALQSEINKLATMVKVIMMAMGKTPIMGGASNCKGKAKSSNLGQMWDRRMSKRMRSLLTIWNNMLWPLALKMQPLLPGRN